MEVTVRLLPETQRVLRALSERLTRSELFAGIFRVFDKLASRAAGYIIANKLSGQVLKRRSGALARSLIGRAVYDSRGLPGLRVGTFRGPADRYAAVLEHGTRGLNPESPFPTIVPVRARYLAMPVDDALTPAGVARWRSPRDFPGRLVFIPFRKSGIAVGALYDARSLRRAGGGRVSLESARKLWVLLKKLDLPAYHYLRSGLREFVPQIATELLAYFRQLFAEVQAGRPV